ncbi:MAG: hypothetical protein ED559_01450 [Phycisphaera sp.]|nr:MAG: hypothetical protein ED559_01450 [Phycisphaera sp.]
MVVFTAILASVGCTGPVKQPRSFLGDFPAVVVADWNDIAAAFSRSRLRSEAIRVTHSKEGEGEAGSVARYEVISIYDDHVLIELTTLENWPAEDGGPVPIEISVTSLDVENDTFNRAMVGELVLHLDALAGRDIAPSSD